MFRSLHALLFVLFMLLAIHSLAHAQSHDDTPTHTAPRTYAEILSVAKRHRLFRIDVAPTDRVTVAPSAAHPLSVINGAPYIRTGHGQLLINLTNSDVFGPSTIPVAPSVAWDGDNDQLDEQDVRFVYSSVDPVQPWTTVASAPYAVVVVFEHVNTTFTSPFFASFVKYDVPPHSGSSRRLLTVRCDNLLNSCWSVLDTLPPRERMDCLACYSQRYSMEGYGSSRLSKETIASRAIQGIVGLSLLVSASIAGQDGVVPEIYNGSIVVNTYDLSNSSAPNHVVSFFSF